MKRVLITTTIHVPENLRAWRNAGMSLEDVVIVAGDTNSPHEAIEAFLKTLPGDNRYLRPEDQLKWRCSSVIGWKSVQRRNIALLEAMVLKPDYIVTVDDDNFPLAGNHFSGWDAHLDGSDTTYDTVSSDNGWWNYGEMLAPPVVMRGFPLEVRHAHPNLRRVTAERLVGLTAALWLGDPDCDAIQRIERAPETLAVTQRDAVLEYGTWCPFNSQATAYLGVLAPLMNVWPFVGRYDDIWSSLLAQRVMLKLGYTIRVGGPAVRQTRNPHNFLTDLKNEMLGLEYTWELADVLRNMALPPIVTTRVTPEVVLDALVSAYQNLLTVDFLPADLKAFFHAWSLDCITALR